MSVGTAPTILITRPEPGATATAQKLRALGFNAVVQPFTEMIPKEYSRNIIDQGSVEAVVVTSANALRYLTESDCAALSALPIYVVGDATMAMARKLGFNRITSADGNALDLVSIICSKLKPRSRILYVCGETRTADVEVALRDAQFSIHVVETYKTEKISQLTDKMNNHRTTNNFDAVVFYSSISAQIFADLLDQVDSAQLSEIKIFFCISERAKRRLPAQILDRVMVAPKPRDDEMIKLLQRQYFD